MSQSSSEKKYLEEQKKMYPSLFIQDDLVEDDKLLEKVGISNLKRSSQVFWHKMFSPDFIVEEKNNLFGQTSIDYEGLSTPTDEGDTRTLFVTLVKCNINTIDVIKDIAYKLNIEESRIGYAGLKDKYAITSQTISLRGVSFKDIENLKSEYYFLKNARYGNGVIVLGDLVSNKFTLTLRHNSGKISESVFEEVRNNYQKTKEEGFKNFYYLQRFSSPRYTNMYWGFLIFKGLYEDAVRLVITQKGEHEIEFFRSIRDLLNDCFGDYLKMKKILEPFEVSFSTERALIDYLVDKPDDFLGALKSVPEQVKLWVYALPSYYFNKKISNIGIADRSAPKDLPLVLTRSIKSQEKYKNYLLSDGLFPIDFSSIDKLGFIQVRDRKVATVSRPKVYDFRKTEDGFMVSFSLSKGEYATTFLSHLFTIGQPGLQTKEKYNPNFNHFDVLKLKTLEKFLPIIEESL